MSEEVVQISFKDIILTDEELRDCVQSILYTLGDYDLDAEPKQFRVGFATAMKIVVLKLLNPDLDLIQSSWGWTALSY